MNQPCRTNAHPPLTGHAEFSLASGTIETLFGFTAVNVCRNRRVESECDAPHRPEPHMPVWRVAQGEYRVLGNDTPKKEPAEKTATKVQSKDRDMGSALRSVYQKAVDEQVPDDLMDLLGKLK